LLETCDNFVVLVIERNVEGVDFYLLQCQWPKNLVCEAFHYIWSGEFDVGDYVVVPITKSGER
jgi:hypothetical protein